VVIAVAPRGTSCDPPCPSTQPTANAATDTTHAVTTNRRRCDAFIESY